MTIQSEKPRRGSKGGVCGGCGREVGGLTYHQRYCLKLDHDVIASRTEALSVRSSAHAAAPGLLRAAQRFQHGVTDLDVARVMAGLEEGTRLYRNRAGSWLAPDGTPLAARVGRPLSTTVGEMIRTGLVRHYRTREGDHLLPAPVHYLDRTDGLAHSACLFTGEDMGPMRSRLTERLDLVDCLACELVVSTGTVRGL